MSDAEDFARLAKRLKDMGDSGLQRELSAGIDAAVQPFERTIADPLHMYPYMPDRYANVLAADLKVSTVKRASRVLYGVSVRIQGRAHPRRALRSLEQGILKHPVFGRMSQPWVTQFAGMRAGFFSSAVNEAKPGIQRDIEAVIHRIGEQITHG